MHKTFTGTKDAKEIFVPITSIVAFIHVLDEEYKVILNHPSTKGLDDYDLNIAWAKIPKSHILLQN